MRPSNAPGPDGYTTSFFHQSWEFIGKDIYKEVKEILNDGKPLGNWTKTIVALIPKVKKLERIKDYRPVSIYNVNYKIVARAITNKL